jgi:hypothetical protein
MNRYGCTALVCMLLGLLGLQGQEAVLPAQILQPRLAVTAALNDCDQQAKEDQPFLRYLYLPVNSDVFFQALRVHVNLLSREAQLAYPKQVMPGLWRVDLRDYQWNPKVWEKLADIDPYFHRKQNQEIVEVITEEVEVYVDQPYGYYSGSTFIQTEVRREKQTRKRKREKRSRVVQSLLYVPLGAGQLASLSLLSQSQAPIVRADWFLVQGARQISLNNNAKTGVGYYDWLELPDRDAYFKLIGENENESVRLQTEIRAVVSESGISAQNRQIVRTGVITGKHWTTLDVFDQSGKGIAIQTLRRGEFNHDTEEHYAPLANGLPVTFLSDAKGVRQDSAPDKLGGNRSDLNKSADTRIHVNFSCIQCHQGAILMGISDDVRPVYTGRLGVLSNSKDVSLELRRQYGASLETALDKDRSEYQDAFHKITGKPAQATMTLYSLAFTHYAYDRVDLQTAANELGAPDFAFLKTLKEAAVRQGRGDFRLDPFLTVPPKSIQRLTWEDAFQDAQDLHYGVLKQ